MGLRNLAVRYPIAVDLSDPLAPVAVQVSTHRGTTALRGTFGLGPDAEAPRTDEDMTAFLRDALRHSGFKGKSVALLPPPGTVLSYPISVETAKDESLEAAIVREAREILDFPVEDAVLDYASVRADATAGRRSSRVIVVAARKSDMDRYSRLVRQAGGTLELVESAVSALVRAHCSVAPLQAKPSLLCCIGGGGSVIGVADRDGILAHRDVAWGVDLLRAKLAENLELGGRDVDFLLQREGVAALAGGEGGEDSRGTVSQLLAPLVDEFIHHLHNVMGYVRSLAVDVSFGGAFLYGDGTRVLGLGPYVSRELGLEAETANPMERLHVSKGHAQSGSADGGRCALAFGLAARRVRWL